MEGSEKCESDLETAVLEKWMLTGQQDRLDTWFEKYEKKTKALRTVCVSRDGWLFVRGRLQNPSHCMKKHWIF